MQNSKTLFNATKDSINSYGSAVKENEKYLNSIEGKIARFNSTVEKMWNNTINSDHIKNIIDLGTHVIELIDKIGLMPVVLGSVSTYLTTVKGIAISIKGVSLGAVFAEWAFKMGIAETSALNLGIALDAIAPLAIIAGIVGISKAIDSLIVSSDELLDSFNQTTNNIDTKMSELKELQREYEGLSSKVKLNSEEKIRLIEIEQDIKKSFGESAQEIDLQNKSLEENNRIMKQFSDQENELYLTLNKQAYVQAKKHLEEQNFFSNQTLYKQREGYLKQIEQANRLNIPVNDFIKRFNEVNETIENYETIVDEYEARQNQLNQSVDNTSQIIHNQNNILSTSIQNYEELDSSIDDLQKSGKGLSSVYQQLNEGQQLSADQILDMIQDYPELLDLVDEQNGLNLQSADIYDKLFNIKKRNTLQTLEDEKAKAEATINSLEIRKQGYLSFYKAMDGMITVDPKHFDPSIIKSLELAQKDKAQIEARINALNNLTLDSFQSHTNSSSKSASHSLTEVTGKLTDFSTAFKVVEEKINNTAIAIKTLNDQLKDTEDIEKRKQLEQELSEQYEKQNGNYKELINENRTYLTSTLNDLSQVTSVGIENINKAFKFDKTGIIGFNPTEYGKLLDSIKNKILSNDTEIKRLNGKYGKERSEAIKAQQKPLEDENTQLKKLYDNMNTYIDGIQKATDEINNTKDAVSHLTDKTVELNKKTNDTRQKEIDKFLDSYLKSVQKAFKYKQKMFDRDHKDFIEHLQNRIKNENKYYKHKKEQIEEDRDKIINSLQSQIDDKQKQLNQNKKLIEQEKRLAEIADLRKKVANIKKNRNVRILTENGWEWVADKKALEDAQKELDDKLQRDKEIRDEDAKQKEINDLKDKLNNEKKYYDRRLKKLEKNHQLELEFLNDKIDKENKAYEKQKRIIDDYYESKINSIDNIENKEITYLDVFRNLTKEELELYDDKIKKIHELEKAKLDALKVGDIDSGHSSSSGSSHNSHNYKHTDHNDGDKENLNKSEQAKVDELTHYYKVSQKNGNTAGMKYFHNEVEKLRKKHGYSGGADGSEYNKLGTGGIVTRRGLYMLGDAEHGSGDQVEPVFNSKQTSRLHNVVTGGLSILGKAQELMAIGNDKLFDTIPAPNLNISNIFDKVHQSPMSNQTTNRYDIHIDKVESPDADSFINYLPTIAKSQG